MLDIKLCNYYTKLVIDSFEKRKYDVSDKTKLTESLVNDTLLLEYFKNMDYNKVIVLIERLDKLSKIKKLTLDNVYIESVKYIEEVKIKEKEVCKHN